MWDCRHWGWEPREGEDLHAESSAQRAEELEAAGWSYDDGTISDLPLGSSGGIRPY